MLMRNPRTLIAIDTSEALLNIAKASYPDVEFTAMDMMHLTLPHKTFDIVYASLVFHYANDWDKLLASIARVLKPGGILLFSTHHPQYWNRRPTGNMSMNERGVTLTEHTATLPGGVEITYYNHADTRCIDEAVEHAGFDIQTHYAPQVLPVKTQTLDAAQRKKYENLAATNKVTPLFYLVRAVRS